MANLALEKKPSDWSFTVKDSKDAGLGRVRCAALCAALVVANLPASAFAQSSCPGIHVKILGIRNSTGTVACALFESPAGLPAEFLHFATNIVVAKALFSAPSFSVARFPYDGRTLDLTISLHY